MRRLKILLFISCLMICNNSCSNVSPEATAPPKESDALVGRVASVYPQQNYMLIQKYRNFNTEIDVIFYSRGLDGSVSSLKMTGQKLGQFYIADLSNGSYAVNDPVFMRDLRNSSQLSANKTDGNTQEREHSP